jgi:hypothetical protein
MKKKILGGIVAAAALGLAVAAPAHADWHGHYWQPDGYRGDKDTYLYYHEMVSQGIPGTPWAAYGAAQRTCGFLADGYSEESMIQGNIDHVGLTRSQSEVVVWGAEWHFCPAYY